MNRFRRGDVVCTDYCNVRLWPVDRIAVESSELVGQRIADNDVGLVINSDVFRVGGYNHMTFCIVMFHGVVGLLPQDWLVKAW